MTQERNKEASADLRAAKFDMLKAAFLEKYRRETKTFAVAKRATAAAFAAFTLVSFALGRASGRPMAALLVWIVALFTVVFVFVIREHRLAYAREALLPFFTKDEITALDWKEDALETDGEETEEEE